MELKFKIEPTKNERRFLYFLFALILCILNAIFIYNAANEIDYLIPKAFKGIVAIGMLWTWIFTSNALFKHYK